MDRKKAADLAYAEGYRIGSASRDAEVAELQKAIDENWVTHQQIVAASKERDQLRDEIAELVAALETVIPEVAGGNAGGNAGLIAYNKCKAALAKVMKPT